MQSILYSVIWPLSARYEDVASACLDLAFVGPTPQWAYVVKDSVTGTFYIVVGTIWVWCLGRAFSIGATRLFPVRKDKSLA